MEQKKISVIVPVYNGSKYLEKCIVSVLRQTYDCLELLLINDGSTDNSLDICEKYADLDSRVTIFNNNNEGVSVARNIGIENATGHYLYFLDSDDWLEDDFIKNMVTVANNQLVPICQYVQEYGEYCQMTSRPELVDMSKWYWPIINDYSLACWRLLFDKHIVNMADLRFIGGRKYGEDQEFSYKYLICSKRVPVFIDALYHYRRHSESVMSRGRYELFDVIEALREVEQLVTKECDENEVRIIVDHLEQIRIPSEIELVVATLMGSEKSVLEVYKYIEKSGYAKTLDDIASKKVYNSVFILIWKVSHFCALLYYKVGKRIKHLFC